MSEEIQVGTVLYREMTGRNAGTKIKEEVVKRIGAKYIYLDGYSERYPVDRKTLQHVSKEYCQTIFNYTLQKRRFLTDAKRVGFLTCLNLIFLGEMAAKAEQIQLSNCGLLLKSWELKLINKPNDNP